MYLRSLELTHIRLFGSASSESVVFDFTRNGEPRMFTVILAENGYGKSTILQTIALAASGVGGANKLADDAAAFFDKRIPSIVPGTATAIARLSRAEIGARFRLSGSLHGLREYPQVLVDDTAPQVLVDLAAPYGWKQFTGTSKYDHYVVSRPLKGVVVSGILEEVRARDLPLWFVAGYGPSRSLPDPSAQSEPGQRSIDRLQSLFRNRSLIATGFADILNKQFGPEVALAYSNTLREVLIGDGKGSGILPLDEALSVKDIELRGQGGARNSSDLLDAERFVVTVGGEDIKLPAVWLSAGYQSTIAWIADLIGQVALDAKRVVPPAEMEGLVLIDEIDLHLHPRWQMRLVPALKRIFPRVQFIATTHSPMVLPGLQSGEVMVLQADEKGRVVPTIPDEDPRLLTASQLYREFFGIDQVFPSMLGDKLRRYGLLAGIAQRSDDEERQLKTLYDELRAAGVDPGEAVPREMPDSVA